MDLFQRPSGLEGLPRILDKIWHMGLNNRHEKIEEREIEEALKSIETGMGGLQKILNKR